MDQVNRRSRDFRYCIKLSTGFFRDSSSAKTTNSIQPVRRRGEVGGFGGGETSEEGGYRGGRALRKSVSVKHFHDTQEGWREKAGGRHEGLEQFHRTSSFQNGASVTFAITPLEGGFYVQDRLKRCISNNSNCKKIKDLPKVSLERETLPVHMPTFRPQILSKNFHKGSETSLSLPQSSGSSAAGVFRRHTYHGSNPRAIFGAYTADMAVVDRFRFSGKPKEVSFNTQTTSRIPGVHCKFHRNEIVFNGRKTVKSKTRSREAAEIKPSGKDIGKLLGLLPVNSSSHCSGSSPFQKFTGRYDKGLKRLRGGQGYRSVVCLSPEAKEELEWWRDYVKMNNGKSILPPEEQDTIFSDASKQGWGAHLNLAKIGGRWNWEEKLKSHVNWLELKAAFLALQAFLPQLKHQHVQIGIDNKTAMTYINKLGGTRSHRLTSLALEMWNFAADRNLTLSAVYVPGEENQIADKKSRVFQDSLEWMLHPAVFQALQKEVGCFSIDLFATRVNHQVPAFVSWRPEPGAVATDAFNVKWDFQLAYLFPPFCMIKRCLRKIQQDQAHCVLITPVWKSSP